MNRLRALCTVAIIVGLAACGGGSSDGPSSVDATGQSPQPTAVFSDDFEKGETEDWKTEGVVAVGEEVADGEADEAQTPPE